MATEMEMLSSNLLAAFTNLVDIGKYHMNRGTDAGPLWHAVQEDDDVYVVLEVQLPKSEKIQTFVEIDNDSFGTLTGVRVPVGKTTDYPALYGDAS